MARPPLTIRSKASRHRLAGQLDQVVADQGKKLDQVAVGVDDGVVEPVADVGHLAARCELPRHGCSSWRGRNEGDGPLAGRGGQRRRLRPPEENAGQGAGRLPSRETTSPATSVAR